MTTIPTIKITPLDVLSAYCNGNTAELYADLLSKLTAIGASPDDTEVWAIASGYYVHLSVIGMKQYPDSDEAQCYDLMMDEGGKAIPEILWEILDRPASTAWFNEFQNFGDKTLKRLKAKDWAVMEAVA